MLLWRSKGENLMGYNRLCTINSYLCKSDCNICHYYDKDKADKKEDFKVIDWEKKLTEKNIKVIDYMNEDLVYIYDAELEEYFSCIDTMEEYYQMKGLEMPKYAYGTYLEPVSLGLDDILENACSDHAEGVEDNLNGVSELREAIEKFNQDNMSTGSYYPDYKVVVKLFIN